jgi:16S rRNA (uracil1498-N3)-methyltransferase
MLFYTPVVEDGLALLDEEESRHLLTVLRRKPGDRLRLTDGTGFFYEAVLTEAGKKQAVARILEKIPVPRDYAARLHVGLAPPKNIDRFEWFLEKAVEIGVDEITPLLCARSEREHIRLDRLEKIAVSAMKQSMRGHLPKVNPLTPLSKWMVGLAAPARFMPWIAEPPEPHLKTALKPGLDTVIAIGPEGDFSPEEVALAKARGFAGAGLGSARLRTETAGILAVTLFNMVQ